LRRDFVSCSYHFRFIPAVRSKILKNGNKYLVYPFNYYNLHFVIFFGIFSQEQANAAAFIQKQLHLLL